MEVEASLLLDEHNVMKPYASAMFQKFRKDFHVSMTFNGQFQLQSRDDQPVQRIFLQIYGSYENTQRVHQRCLILLDELVLSFLN